jgi:hypothetical protein
MANSPTIQGTIRVSIPASVASNIKTLKSSLKSIAERLGCGKCFSGADCFFQLQNRYLIDEKLQIAAHTTAVSDAIPAKTSAKNVYVNLSSKASYDINTVLASIDKIAELSGHVACATGCNLFFRNFIRELDVFDVNDKGIVNQFKASV